MKQKVRCCFIDFWPGFDYKYHLAFLLSEYEIIIDKENPDYLFYSCFGRDHLNYDDCIKIFWSGENMIPDLNLCDYSVSLSEIQCGDRTFTLRVPEEWKNFHLNLDEEGLLNRKFCNFVYTNNLCADPFREKIFKSLSTYKRIDSGGSFLNNMGEKVKDKHAFLKEYKFTLAIENSSQPGYVTEKFFDPLKAQSLPIYWGSSSISSIYNPNSFVNLMEYSSMEEAIEEIIRLDNDDAAYLEKVTSPFWTYGNSFEEFYNCEIEKLVNFFRNIFEQPLDKARRRAKYGYAQGYSSDLKKYYFYPEKLLKDKYVKPLKDMIKKIIRK